MTPLRLGPVSIEIGTGWTVTRLPNGREVWADHAEQPGQAETAARCGYESAGDLNREHDLAHSLLAYWLGLDASPTLLDVSLARPRALIHDAEEAAVLAVQTFARAVGVDLVEVARRASSEV